MHTGVHMAVALLLPWFSTPRHAYAVRLHVDYTFENDLGVGDDSTWNEWRVVARSPLRRRAPMKLEDEEISNTHRKPRNRRNKKEQRGKGHLWKKPSANSEMEPAAALSRAQLLTDSGEYAAAIALAQDCLRFTKSESLEENAERFGEVADLSAAWVRGRLLRITFATHHLSSSLLCVD